MTHDRKSWHQIVDFFAYIGERLLHMRRITKTILNELGVLLVPTALVTLFCQLLKIDDQATAGYSICAVLFLTCCVHRGWINARVPSSLILAVLIGFGTIFFFNYRNILLKDTGLLVRYRQSADFQADVGRQIASARKEIWFFGTNFHISAVERRPILLERLRSGVNIRYLILNPFIPHLEQVARDFGQSKRELEVECLKGMNDLIELRRRWDAERGRSAAALEIRLFDTTPRARLYVFDPDDPAGRTMFVPYLNRVNSPNLPGYLLENSETGVFRSYFDALRIMWNESTPLDTLLAAHPDLQP